MKPNLGTMILDLLVIGFPGTACCVNNSAKKICHKCDVLGLSLRLSWHFGILCLLSAVAESVSANTKQKYSLTPNLKKEGFFRSIGFSWM